MYRQTQNITTSGCIVISDDRTIHDYDNGSQYTYKLLSDTYYLTETTPNATVPNNAQCYTTEQISELPSPYDFITPFYHLSAIISALFIFYFAYKLIIFPFYRTKP